MARACEVCTSANPSDAGRRVRRVLVEERIVALCEIHAAAYQLSGMSTLDGLAKLFKEAGGKRSLLDRRSPLDRRVFPARPEGRRRTSGRRKSDTDS